MQEISRYQNDNLFFHHTYDARPDPGLFKMHTHDCYELYCFLAGKGKFHIEGTAYPLRTGDVLLMRPAEAHYIEIDPQFPYERVAVHFHEQPFRSIDGMALLKPFNARAAGKENLLTAADLEDTQYRLFLHNMTLKMPQQRLQILINLLPLLGEIAQAVEERQPDTAAPDSTVYKIIQYINAHLCDDLSIGTICKEFYISKPQLCRAFKRATGSTVWEYTTVKRLLCARNLLRSGTPAAAAAAQSGFGEYSAFYRAYRKQFGESPKETGQ